MSHSNRRSHDGTTPERKRLTYAELRGIAAERRAAKEGISRRDFVRAGTAAAIVAATSREAFAGQAKPRDAFDECMTELRTAAKPTTLSTAAAEGLEKYGLPMFTDSNMPIWLANRPRVLASSHAIGAISAALAAINDDKEIAYNHVKEAVAAVKKICKVRANDQKIIFCPEMP